MKHPVFPKSCVFLTIIRNKMPKTYIGLARNNV